jgi:ABC-type multidrug transport system ATPase subunit
MVTMLALDDVGKRYGATVALESVTFDLDAGEIMALIGSNGSGKSTLIKSVVGLIQHTGRVTVNGIDVARDARTARRYLGYLPQHSALHSDLTVRETAIFHADMKGIPHERARAGVEAVGLAEHADKTVAALSGGMRQRLGLAVALLADPPLLVLDEPATGLDIAARLELRDLVGEQRTRGTAVLLSTHWLEDVPYLADRVLTLEGGRVKSIEPASALVDLAEARSRVYLRMNGHSPDAIPLLARLFPNDPIAHTGDWLVVTTAASRKASVVGAVVDAGMHVLDLRVEEVGTGAPGGRGLAP